MSTYIPIAKFAGVLGAAGFLSTIVPAVARDEGDPRMRAPIVQTVPVKAATNGLRSFTGLVTARVHSNIGFRVTGKVIERLVDVGQEVKAGQPLMRLDDTDLKLTLRAKEDAVTAARAAVTRTLSDENRFQRLVATGAASHQLYEQAKEAFDSAEARLDAAIADVTFARDQVGYTLLYADADGIVTDTLAEPGQVVAAGQPVVKLAHSGDREASINLPETVRPKLGSTGIAMLYGEQNAPKITARLRQLSSAADPTTRTFEARYVLESADDLPLGATVKVAIATAPIAVAGVAVEVPVGAIWDNGSQAGVWELTGAGTAKFTPVRVVRLGEEVAVVDGVAVGTTIVAMGVNQLHDGMAVRPANAEVASK